MTSHLDSWTPNPRVCYKQLVHNQSHDPFCLFLLDERNYDIKNF